MTAREQKRAPWRTGFCGPTMPADSHGRCPVVVPSNGKSHECSCDCHKPPASEATAPSSSSGVEQQSGRAVAAAPAPRSPGRLLVLPDLIQGTEEWHDQRRGMVTASVVGQLITVGPPSALTVACPACGVEVGPCVSQARKEATPLKTVHGARSERVAHEPPVYSVADNDTSRGLTAMLAAEHIAGFTEPTSVTADMWRGIDSEPYARDLYSEHFAQATEVGFMVREEATWRLGYSPDGLVGDDGLIEIKAPRSKTHLRTIIADEVPAHYMAQCQAGLLVSGREWLDFVSYVGGMPLYRKRVTPDPKWFAAITAACKAYETNLAQIVADYEQRVADLPKTERIDLDIKVA